MTTYFVSRHPGAIAWVKQQDFALDQLLTHLDASLIEAGDRVIGTLPIHLAARVCESGGRYFHLSLDLSAEKRGQELSIDELREYGAVVEEFLVRKSPPNSALIAAAIDALELNEDSG